VQVQQSNNGQNPREFPCHNNFIVNCKDLEGGAHNDQTKILAVKISFHSSLLTLEILVMGLGGAL
jgi:hypothetical protein